MSDRTITLHLDGERIAAQTLHQRIGVFLDLLHEVDRNVTEEAEGPSRRSTSVKWIVAAIRSGSPVDMTLLAEPANEQALPAMGDRVIASVANGLTTLQSAEAMRDLPRYFSLTILEHVHGLIRPGTDGVKQVAVRTPERTITLSDQAEKNLHRFLLPVYTHFGSVEGTLEMVSVARGTPRFSVRDRLSGRSIRCSVPKERTQEVIAAFNRRVSVEGRVRTNERGDVLSVHMESLGIFPPDDQLPDIEQVAGAFDLTMGKSVAEHLERLRDAS